MIWLGLWIGAAIGIPTGWALRHRMLPKPNPPKVKVLRIDNGTVHEFISGGNDEEVATDGRW